MGSSGINARVHGTSSRPEHSRMRTFAFVLLAVAGCHAEAEAEAKADPYFYNGVYGGIGHYGGVYGYPYAGVGHHVVYGKREAEAEPKADAEADPAIVSTAAVVSTYGHPIVSTAVKTVVPSVYGHGIYGVGVYGYPYSGVHYGVYGKREAEAKPYVYGFPYTTGFGYAHTPYIGYGVYHG